MSDSGTEAALNRHDRLVGAIYQAVLEPGTWPEVLGEVVREVGGNAGWIAVHYPNAVRSTYQIEYGTDPAWQQRLRDSYVAASPFIGMVHYVSAGDVLGVGDVVDYDEFRDGRFYREWALPQGWPDLVFAVLAREPDRFSFLGVCLPGRVDAQHKRRAARLLPHLDRALRIADLVALNVERLEDVTAAIEAMATGMILVDADLNLRGINSAASGLIDWRTDIAQRQGKLHLGQSGGAARIAAAIGAAARRTASPDGEVLALDDEGEGALTVHVVPLPRPQQAGLRTAVAALFVSDPDRPQSLPPDGLASRFGLTPSEVRVALALAEGSSPRDIADTQGVSLATVRTHLRRLYDKTGTGGQAALVRLVDSATRAV